MIAQFAIENFRSFKGNNTFSLVATSDKELLESNTFEGKKNRFLKTAVIYGANASGKSNFFKALVFFLNFAVYSAPRKQAGDSTNTEPFVFSRQTESAPSSFEIIFFVNNQGIETRYRYSFTISKTQVLEESLFALYNKRETMIFKRYLQEITCSSAFKEGTRSKSSVRTNCTFLSVCAQNNGVISREIIAYFRNMSVLYGPATLYNEIILGNKIKKENKEANVKFLKCADFQIIGINTEIVPTLVDIQDDNGAATVKNMQYERVEFGHVVYDEENPVAEKYINEDDESAGTQRLYYFSKYILGALEEGTALFIDEFDIMLHPLIIEYVIKLFNSSETNPRNAQLVISSHAVNIMTKKNFRRDQIWFCEKDQYGATDLYSLVEYKEPVRKDATYNKDYLSGKYGAIPYLDELFNKFK